MKNKLPPVSIGIPFFNDERFLLDAIRSVFAQTHRDWELILVDDGSTDRSLEIARSVVDSRVRVYSDGRNKKLAARLNEICSLAQYDFVARMDADDLMATDRIEKQLRFLLDHPECDLVTAGVCSITDESIPYGLRIPSKDHSLTPSKVLSGAHGIIHAAIVGRKSWFLRNPYDPMDVRAQDYKLWVRATLRQDLAVGFIFEPLYFYREEGSTTTQKMMAGRRLGREVVRSSGPRLIGPLGTVYLLVRSHLKSIFTQMAALIGGTRYMVRARSPVVDSSTFSLIQHEIRSLRRVAINLKEKSA